jgi:hypothetical protein
VVVDVGDEGCDETFYLTVPEQSDIDAHSGRHQGSSLSSSRGSAAPTVVSRPSS